MTLKVYTSTVSYLGPDKLDITVKSGDRAFAPTWGMVHGLKHRLLKQETYTHQYKQLMEDSLRKNVTAWSNLFSRESVVLCCYCPPGKFCHRRILAGILERMGCQIIGEITPLAPL